MSIQNSIYIADQSEMTVIISAEAVARIAALTTAEEIDISLAVNAAAFTNVPQKVEASVGVVGSPIPLTASKRTPDGLHELTIELPDDYYRGSPGTFGTDNLSAVELFKLHKEHNVPLGGLQLTPAGAETGMKELSLTAPVRVKSVSLPGFDAANREIQMVTVVVTAPEVTDADHA